ncbi:HypC/HybG/HupF family hydrogenase formation chaperone [Rhabdothermincola sediminis]|uniref:HypC/HybG/HupF family hydrogenase formation chaperone n=1 Tax=Rhabdothermincola sediminis TaxID=2751370 RepID=UPI001AA05CC0|nr:HypC/HybG/HupF family hydrogenase formation chaperone [Rhabdothermincola sediminis]
MCLSLVGRVCEVNGEHARVDAGGTIRSASIAMQLIEGTDVREGDWVLVHTGFVVTVLGEDDARQIARARAALADLEGATDA